MTHGGSHLGLHTWWCRRLSLLRIGRRSNIACASGQAVLVSLHFARPSCTTPTPAPTATVLRSSTSGETIGCHVLLMVAHLCGCLCCTFLLRMLYDAGCTVYLSICKTTPSAACVSVWAPFAHDPRLRLRATARRCRLSRSQVSTLLNPRLAPSTQTRTLLCVYALFKYLHHLHHHHQSPPRQYAHLTCSLELGPRSA